MRPSSTIARIVVDEMRQKIISIELPDSEGHLPVRYLGLPLISARLSLADCQPLLQKIDNHIKGWEAAQLSFAGEFNLSNQSWSPSSGYPKVAWETVCRPIEEGGLGIKDILALNRALMIKDNKGAWGWRKMLSLRHALMSQIHYRVGNVVIKDGQWNWPLISDIACWKLLTCSPISEGPDIISWNSKDGAFNTSTAYELFHPPGPKVFWSSLLLGPSKSRKIALSFGLLLWGDCLHLINRGFTTLTGIAFYARMESLRHTTTYSFHALFPDIALPLSVSISHFHGPTGIGNMVSNGRHPDGVENMWLMQHIDVFGITCLLHLEGTQFKTLPATQSTTLDCGQSCCGRDQTEDH
ncbi:hypothetical protein Sango_3034600 [Sesamum angolense]|uniref:Uncharacterized protein n=1 Tax=Sesamum angolense TaxID=2727404 RepID=A0AAE1TB55_9LAMI|nr:hypothetical protein Sango_3034600 [Sesamum angolense]